MLLISFQINGHDVRQASHEQVVNFIRKSGDLVKLSVVTVAFEPCLIPPKTPPLSATTNLNISTPNGTSTPNNSRQYSTLPRKLHQSTNRVSIQPPPPPKRDPSTTLSVGRARARSMVANMAALEALDKAINEHDSSTSESVTGSVDSVQRMPDLVLESGLNSVKSGNSEEMDLTEQNNNKSRVYASVAEMKRMKVNTA